MQKVYNWEELKEYIDSNCPDREIFIDVDMGFGRITIDDYHYLSTHTFYGKGDKDGIKQYQSELLQSYGVNVWIMGDGIE